MFSHATDFLAPRIALFLPSFQDVPKRVLRLPPYPAVADCHDRGVMGQCVEVAVRGEVADPILPPQQSMVDKAGT